MRENYLRYLVTFLIAVGLIVLVVVLIVRALGSGKDAVVAPQINLVDYAKTSVVMRMTINGPVAADQTHRSVIVTVGAGQNEAGLFSGYERSVLAAKSYASNTVAYANFLRAVDLAGMTSGTDAAALADYRGHCPLGRSFIFEVLDGQKTIKSYWATSCGNTGNFRGDTNLLRRLFQAQIPDYNQLVRSTGLY